MNVERERICYNALSRVLREGAYSSLALNDSLGASRGDEEFITRLFYGVLEKNISLDYLISELTDRKPKPAVAIIIKMGAYMVRYMNVADYAAVNRCVELAKVLGKGGAGGFINAVLRKIGSVRFPEKGEMSDEKYLSVNYGLPEWLAQELSETYGADFVKCMMETEPFLTHIRLIVSDSAARVDKFLSEHAANGGYKTKYGYYVTHNTLNLLTNSGVLKKSDFAVQSLASAAAVQVYADGLSGDSTAVDLCAAPGGKSVYLKQLTGCDVTACDIHKHRLNLISSYANRMAVCLKVLLNDACVEKKDFLGAFDCVICDVPCSGSGDLRSKPDILLRRTSESVSELFKLQTAILRQAAKYVRDGGKLCYSTCSVLKEEDEEVVSAFLKHNPDFTLEDCSRFADELRCGKYADESIPEICEGVSGRCMKLFPHIHDTDGFFVAVLRKKEARGK